MKILIDESLPRFTLQLLQEHEAYTVQYMGWEIVHFQLTAPTFLTHNDHKDGHLCLLGGI